MLHDNVGSIELFDNVALHSTPKAAHAASGNSRTPNVISAIAGVQRSDLWTRPKLYQVYTKASILILPFVVPQSNTA